MFTISTIVVYGPDEPYCQLTIKNTAPKLAKYVSMYSRLSAPFLPTRLRN